jgi:Reverse transcriptase (RNA-dependent DNA polymerase)
MVLNVFKCFFCFSTPVAELLADLCTKDGILPQGACASSYIANLIFWQNEHRLVRQFREVGLIYTRLIDDITISSATPLSKKKIEGVVKSVTAMIGLDGFKLKKRKTKIVSAENPESLMEVTGLWLNRGKPRVQRVERMDIRSEVRQCTETAKFDRISPEYHELHERVSGRVAKLAQLNHHEAGPYRKELSKILPVYGLYDVRKTKGMVEGLGKTAKKSIDNISYIKKYYSIVRRVNILARTQPALADSLRSELVKYVPKKTKDEVIHG